MEKREKLQFQSTKYLECFGGSATVESYAEIDLVILFQDFKGSFFPFGGSKVHVMKADFNNSTTGNYGRCTCHGLKSSENTLEAVAFDKTSPAQRKIYNYCQYHNHVFHIHRPQ